MPSSSSDRILVVILMRVFLSFLFAQIYPTYLVGTLSSFTIFARMERILGYPCQDIHIFIIQSFLKVVHKYHIYLQPHHPPIEAPSIG
jgi:hypothetical protein